MDGNGPHSYANGVGRSTLLNRLHLLVGGATLPHKQEVDYTFVFTARLMHEVMRSHPHPSFFCHHVHHTPGLRSKAHLTRGPTVFLGRMDLSLSYSGHSD